MIREELKTLPTGRKELRNFGLLIGGILLILGAWLLNRAAPIAPVLLAIGVPLLILGLLTPAFLRRPYLIWMTLALIMGLIVSTIILSLFYACVITPFGWAARLAGKDFMRRKIQKEATTYWITREPAPPPATYEQQY